MKSIWKIVYRIWLSMCYKMLFYWSYLLIPLNWKRKLFNIRWINLQIVPFASICTALWINFSLLAISCLTIMCSLGSIKMRAGIWSIIWLLFIYFNWRVLLILRWTSNCFQILAIYFVLGKLTSPCTIKPFFNL